MKRFIVRTRPEAFGDFTQAWTKEVETKEEALQLISECEAEDKVYGCFRAGYYEIIER